MNKSESKYFRTAEKMDQALLSLLKKKSFPYITVKELCEKAEVNRSTFYLHYDTMDDLIIETVDYLSKRFQQHIHQEDEKLLMKIRTCPVEELYLVTPRYLEPYLSFVREYDYLFIHATEHTVPLRMEETYERMFRQVFTPILERFGVPLNEHRAMMEFYIRGLVGIVNLWIREGCKESVEQMIQVIQRCVGTIVPQT